MKIAEDSAALEAFYREHVDAVERFIARRVGDPILAADLTADVFLAAIDSAHTFRPRKGKPVAWLYGVARNVVAANDRNRARELRALSGVPAASELTSADDLARLHQKIDAEAGSRALYRALERLPVGDRAVLELVALDDLAVVEAAAALGIRPATARVRLFRARRALQDELRAHAIEPNPQLSEAR